MHSTLPDSPPHPDHTFLAAQSLVPVRKDPDENAPLETQILFGQSLICLDKQPKWLLIRNLEDGYEGWIDRKMAAHSASKPAVNRYFVDTPTALLQSQTSKNVFIRLGLHAPVPFAENLNEICLGDIIWTLVEGKLSGPVEKFTQQHIFQQAQRMLGTPYLWGGKSILGIDCSGFTQLIYARFGIYIHRNASQQARQGTVVPWEERQVGDLVFFSTVNSSLSITHVGIIGPELDSVLHASGSVRMDCLSEAGIVHQESQQLTHHLKGIRTFL